MSNFLKNLFNKDVSVTDSDSIHPVNSSETFTTLTAQREKCVRWFQYNNAFGPQAEFVNNVINNLDKAISMPDHHFEWQIGGGLTRAGTPYILKWIDGAFQVIEVDEKTWNELELGENSISFVETQKSQSDKITSALTYHQQVVLKQVYLPHPYQHNGYHNVCGFIELEAERSLEADNIALIMEHTLYYAGRRVQVETYFYPKTIKTYTSGQTVIDFKFPSLNYEERKIQGLFTLTFKLMDRMNSKNTDDWVLISNPLAHPIEVV